MLRALIASCVAAVVLFVWGFVFWMFTPAPRAMMKPVADENRLVYELQQSLPESGCYSVPNCANATDDQGKKAAEERMKNGPMVLVFYRKEPPGPIMMLYGYAHMAASALLAALLLNLALPGLQSFAARWLFVTLLGTFASVWITLSQSIWMMHPWEYSLLYAGFQVVGWVLAGLVLAAIICPKE